MSAPVRKQLHLLCPQRPAGAFVLLREYRTSKEMIRILKCDACEYVYAETGNGGAL